jgi:type I restriction enzyme R subunit
VVQIMDASGRLRTVRYTQYAGEKVRTLYRSATALQARWIEPGLRREVIDELASRGIDLGELAERAKADDADPFDLLCHVAFNAPLLTRRQRAERLRKSTPDFWDQYPPQAREVLAAILDKYAEHGEAEIALPDVLDVTPLSEFGNIIEVAARVGGTEQLREAVGALHRHLYDIAQAG